MKKTTYAYSVVYFGLRFAPHKVRKVRLWNGYREPQDRFELVVGDRKVVLTGRSMGFVHHQMYVAPVGSRVWFRTVDGFSCWEKYPDGKWWEMVDA